jgi:predicted MFS family arabinose efflux permease
MSVLALLLMAWVRVKVPDFPGQPAGKRLPLRHVLALPGIRAVLWVVLTFVLAHNILYTYIAPYLAMAGMAERTDRVLLVFGMASLMGIWGVGLLIDRHLHRLTLGSTLLFAVAALALGAAAHQPTAVYGAVAAWGLAFGGAATLFQTTLAKAAGDAADVAQSMLVTAWNLAIAGGGIGGGLLLDRFGAGAFSPAMLALLLAALAAAWAQGAGKSRGG